MPTIRCTVPCRYNLARNRYRSAPFAACCAPRHLSLRAKSSRIPLLIQAPSSFDLLQHDCELRTFSVVSCDIINFALHLLVRVFEFAGLRASVRTLSLAIFDPSCQSRCIPRPASSLDSISLSEPQPIIVSMSLTRLKETRREMMSAIVGS